MLKIELRNLIAAGDFYVLFLKEKASNEWIAQGESSNSSAVSRNI